MDLLWKGHEFRDDQFADFRYLDSELFKEEEATLPDELEDLPPRPAEEDETLAWPVATVIQYTPSDSQPDFSRYVHSHLVGAGRWSWEKVLSEVLKPSDPGEGRSASVILLPRHPDNPDLPNHSGGPKLRNLPVKEDTFRDVISKFCVHQAIEIILYRGAHAIFRDHYSVKNGKTDKHPKRYPVPCTSYILRTSISTPPDLALSITYFPTLPRLYAVFFGLSPKQIGFIHDRLEFAGSAALLPFTFINIFLEIEKKLRFDTITACRTKVHQLVENVDVSGDNLALVRLCQRVTHLRDQLDLWRGEVVGLRDGVQEGEFAREAEGGRRLLDAGEYLDRLVRGYEAGGRVCDGILQTAGFAFQVVSVSLIMRRGARDDADEEAQEATAMAREDTKTMKAIAVLTMLFLPATFVCVSFPLVVLPLLYVAWVTDRVDFDRLFLRWASLTGMPARGRNSRKESRKRAMGYLRRCGGFSSRCLVD
ncbi:hypothetical protein B0T18DRAFT_413622 [Schizothecium vesticola]|uniref:Cora-domain-containing protein n=1 Tax=Schizothecium vesticola TaxID=314040 RepID=A0AA40K1Q9_9PEZI|nr:hypothetical protein B0T18DRAFT_413622 [Schizothecium vesticola]